MQKVAENMGEVSRFLELPDGMEIMVANGRIPMAGGNTSAEFAANLTSEISQWTKVIGQAGIRVE